MPGSTDSGTKMTEFQREQLSLEREKLKLEETRLRLEQQAHTWKHAWITGSWIPILVALFTIIYGVWSLQQTATAQFSAKVIELSMSAKSPDEALARAQAIAEMVPGMLPQGMITRLKKADVRQFMRADDSVKLDLLRMLQEHPTERDQILGDWKTVFPKDPWILQISIDPEPKSQAVKARSH